MAYKCTYNPQVRYQWDPTKAEGNLKKHGVSFADAVIALEDDFALTIRDPIRRDEERFITLAMDPTGQILAIVYTWREKEIRIISARAATRRERRNYEET